MRTKSDVNAFNKFAVDFKDQYMTDKKSKFPELFFNKEIQRWEFNLKVNDNFNYCGSYVNELTAIKAYNRVLKEYR